MRGEGEGEGEGEGGNEGKRSCGFERGGRLMVECPRHGIPLQQLVEHRGLLTPPVAAARLTGGAGAARARAARAGRAADRRAALLGALLEHLQRALRCGGGPQATLHRHRAGAAARRAAVGQIDDLFRVCSRVSRRLR